MELPYLPVARIGIRAILPRHDPAPRLSWFPRRSWKYHDQFDAGIIANTMVGGDNCHRGAVVGSILAAANGIDGRWTTGLKAFRETSGAF